MNLVCTFWKNFLPTSIFLFLVFSCTPQQIGSPPQKDGGEQLTIVNWNVQTFFDAQNDGSEYDTFVKSSTWGVAAYTTRLERLCSVIKKLDADVFVMEELENENVLYDISNFLSGEWDSKKLYQYACFAKDAGSSIGCGVISRYPLSNMTIHALSVSAMPRMRPLIQVSIEKNGSELVLFVNHWKSMSGGESASEKWRLLQEDVLSRQMSLLEQRGKSIIACGDFNRDLRNFKESKNGFVELRQIDGSDFEVFCPWYDDSLCLIQPGSYYFNEQWSRLDHFFVGSKVSVLEFLPCTNGEWSNSETLVPEKYTIWNGKGYSDHLPIKCTISF